MQEYFLSNGTDKDYMNHTDHWGGCLPENPDSRCPVGDYKEFVNNPKGGDFGANNITMEEPCNYASNVAYYHASTRICDYTEFSIDEISQNALKRSFATLAMGSAFWHGSHTYDGYSFDNNMIAVIAYLAHQASVSYFAFSPILTELSETKRTKTGIDVAEDLVKMFYEKPVYEWAEVLDTCDLPHVYYITFAALVGTGFSLVMPWDFCNWLIGVLCDITIPKEDATFIKEKYLPELKIAVANVPELTKSEKSDLVHKFAGMLMKILYAFLWQEYFIPLKFLYNDEILSLGAEFSVTWNGWASEISGFPQTDEDVVNSKNLYPGE